MMLQLQRVGCFRITRRRKYQSCSLRPNVGSYLQLPDLNNGEIDLMEGFENFDYYQMDYEAVDNVLKFLSARDDLALLDMVEVVTRRGILTKIVNATDKKPVQLLVTKVADVIYIAACPERSSQDFRSAEYRGYKFESVIFGDSPTTSPNPHRRINNAEGFHIVYRANFNGHELLYNAEIDGVEGSSVGVHLEQLKLVEAKSRVKECTWHLREWSQCYFSGVQKLVTGHVTENANLHSITAVHPEKVRPRNVEKYLSFLSTTLDKVKQKMHNINDPNLVYIFDVSPSATRSCRSELKSFLPESYVKKFYKNSR